MSASDDVSDERRVEIAREYWGFIQRGVNEVEVARHLARKYGVTREDVKQWFVDSGIREDYETALVAARKDELKQRADAAEKRAEENSDERMERGGER